MWYDHILFLRRSKFTSWIYICAMYEFLWPWTLSETTWNFFLSRPQGIMISNIVSKALKIFYITFSKAVRNLWPWPLTFCSWNQQINKGLLYIIFNLIAKTHRLFKKVTKRELNQQSEWQRTTWKTKWL